MPKRVSQRNNKDGWPQKREMVKRQKPIRLVAKTEGQQNYIDLIESEDIIVCNGPAGSGKTMISVGVAVKLLKEFPNQYKKILMVRPAVTVEGEDLGHLPGDLDDKLDPFMKPIVDNLQYFLQSSEYLTMIDRGVIEISPISHMRGRTVSNSLIIFDEAQNSTVAQMKMVITRIGFNTKLIIEGDVTQSDLSGDAKFNNGLRDAMERFEGVEGVGVCHLDQRDIVRSPILARLLRTYEE